MSRQDQAQGIYQACQSTPHSARTVCPLHAVEFLHPGTMVSATFSNSGISSRQAIHLKTENEAKDVCVCVLGSSPEHPQVSLVVSALDGYIMSLTVCLSQSDSGKIFQLPT